MNKILSIAALVACCGAAVAQDSVSTNPDGGNGLPGDALSPFAGANAVTSSVLDLVPFSSSGGNQFAIGPLLKTPKVSNNNPAGFFNVLPSGNSMAQTVLQDVQPFSMGYAFWDQQGGGVNQEPFGDGTLNSGGQLISAMQIADAAERIDQVAAHVASFATNTNPGDTEFNGVTAAIVNFDPTNPTRLYVTRVESAINEPAFGAAPTASLAAGGIDATGNGFLRADDNQSGGPNSLIGQNYFRVRNQDRTGVVNQINNLGGADATDDLLRNFTTADPTTAPAIVPSDVGLAGGSVGAANFQSNYKWGNDLANVTVNATTAHYGAADDHRGAIGWYRDQFDGLGANNVGAGAIPVKTIVTLDGGGTEDVTNAISVFGTATDGAVTGQDLLVVPDSVSDLVDPFIANNALGGGGQPVGPGGGGSFWEFGGFGGVTPFRGAPGTVTVGFDTTTGLGLAGGATLDTGLVDTLNNPRGAIHVVRFDPNDPGNPATQNWALAGWADFDARTGGAPAEQWGKPIRDAGGAVIGTMVDLIAVTQQGTTIPGPNTSAPVFDAAGNVYFLTAAQLFKTDNMGVPFTDFDTVLVRGVKQELGNGDFGYELELILEPGDIFTGLNSATDYQIGFIGVAISSGGRSPQTLWGNSGNNVPLGGADQSYDQADPRNMTGLIVVASITYDVDGIPVGGMGSRFNSPSGDATNPSPDESYQVLLYISPAEGAQLQTGCAFADITSTGTCVPGTGDGVVDLSDFSCFLAEWSNATAFADITLTGVCTPGAGGDGVDLSDFSCFLAEWSGGCDGDPGTPAVRDNGRRASLNGARLR